MRPSHIAYGLLWPFLITVFLLNWWQQASYQLSLFVWIFVVTLIPCLFIRFRRYWPLLIATGIGISFALLSVSFAVERYQTQDIGRRDGKLTITGVFSAYPERSDGKTHYVLTVSSVKTADGKTQKTNGKVLVRQKAVWPRYKYDDSVTVGGELVSATRIEEKSYAQYLQTRGIGATMDAYWIDRTKTADVSFFGLLYDSKDVFEAQITKLYPEPQAALLTGLLTGNRSSLPENLTTAFKVAGLTHILAISGTNITIILSVIGSLLFWLPLRWRFVPSIFAIITFTLFTGASASVTRACVMGVLGLIALRAGRQQTPRLTVLWTVFFMLLINPFQLWYDAGFQLSYLALIGVMEGGPLMERVTAWLPEHGGIREGMQMTLAAQIFASPWIVLLFGQLSLIAPIANIIATPMVPFAMLFGFLSLCVGVISTALAQPFVWAAWLCMQWITTVTEWCAHVPFSAVMLPAGQTLWISGYYAVLIFLLYFFNRSRFVEKSK